MLTSLLLINIIVNNGVTILRLDNELTNVSTQRTRLNMAGRRNMKSFIVKNQVTPVERKNRHFFSDSTRRDIERRLHLPPRFPKSLSFLQL
jgi:hypothetical protein